MEKSEHRTSLMSFYNRYMMEPASFDEMTSNRDIAEKMAWKAVFGVFLGLCFSLEFLCVQCGSQQISTCTSAG